MRPLRLAYVIDKMHRAGAQVHLAQLASRLDRSRIEARVHCLLEGGPLADTLRAEGIPVEEWRLGRLYLPRALAGLRRFARRLRSDGIHLVHTYLPSANVFAGLAALHAAGPRLVTSRRDTGFSRNWRLRLLEERLVNPRVDRVVAVTAAIATVAEREPGLAGKVVAIENGIDLERFDPSRAPRAKRAAFGLGKDEIGIAVIGHLSPVKGHEDFLEAAARVASRAPAARFLFAGDGPLRAPLEARARGLGLGNRTTFLGTLPDVRPLLLEVDIVVLPSRTEGMSNALLEAMAMARAVVATAVGGTPEVVSDGRSGRLVPAGSSEALAAAILDLVGDPAEVQRLGALARRHVAERFDVARVVARHQSLYEALCPEALAEAIRPTPDRGPASS